MWATLYNSNKRMKHVCSCDAEIFKEMSEGSKKAQFSLDEVSVAPGVLSALLLWQYCILYEISYPRCQCIRSSLLADRTGQLSRKFFLTVTESSSCLRHLLPSHTLTTVTSRWRTHEKYPQSFLRYKTINFATISNIIKIKNWKI